MTNKTLKNMLLQMKQNTNPDSVHTKDEGFLLSYSILGPDFRTVMRRAKRLAMVLHMAIFDRGQHIEFRTWKRGY